MAIPRQFHTQQAHYIRANVAYNTTNIATGVNVGAIPAGSRILDIGVYIDTAFNAATTNVLTVGTAAGGNQIATTSDTASTATGFKRVTTGNALAQFAADTQVWVTYTQTGTAATAGAATIAITYLPNNDVF